MRVLAIVPSIYDTSPGQRFRIEQWEPLLRGMGVEIAYHPFESNELHQVLYQPGNMGRKAALIASSFGRRFRMLTGAREFDLVYIFREAALLGPAVIERIIGWTGLPVVFDFDDAVFVSYVSPSNGYLSKLKFPGKTAGVCRLSAHVMAGNSYLADYARQYNPNVTIIPTTIDTDKYIPANDNRLETENRKPETTIGWSGSFSTVQHLETLRGALERLGDSERYRLRVIGTTDYRLKGVEVDAMAWRSATEVEDLREMDIGIMPLPDDQWSRGKCGLKALQYMALGIPTICSPVGVNTEIIEDGVNGFLAESDSEWINKLQRLLHSPELRREIGMAGRRTVEGRYSAAVQAPRVYEVFRSVLSERAVR